MPVETFKITNDPTLVEAELNSRAGVVWVAASVLHIEYLRSTVGIEIAGQSMFIGMDRIYVKGEPVVYEMEVDDA